MKQLKLKILPSECDCLKCSTMCQGPCCGTPKEMKELITRGFGSRLMFDDLPGGSDLLKPALKGYEGKKAPWQTASKEGCTFWINGKCELHSSGLKPIQGKLAHHTLTDDDDMKIGNFIKQSWETKEAEEVINIWKKSNLEKQEDE